MASKFTVATANLRTKFTFSTAFRSRITTLGGTDKQTDGRTGTDGQTDRQTYEQNALLWG